MQDGAELHAGPSPAAWASCGCSRLRSAAPGADPEVRTQARVMCSGSAPRGTGEGMAGSRVGKDRTKHVVISGKALKRAAST